MLARPPSGERNPGGTAIQHASALTDFTAQGDLGRARDNYMEKHVYTLYWLVCACNVSSATVQDILLRLYTDGLSTAEAYILCEQLTSTAAAAAIKRLPVGDGDRLAELHDLWLVPYRSVHVQWLLRCFWNLAPEHLRDKNLMNGLLISRRGRHSPIPPAMSTALRHLYEHIRGAPEPIKQKGWRHFAERPAHAVPRALADESTARADNAPCRPDGRPTVDAFMSHVHRLVELEPPGQQPEPRHSHDRAARWDRLLFTFYQLASTLPDVYNVELPDFCAPLPAPTHGPWLRAMPDGRFRRAADHETVYFGTFFSLDCMPICG